jgi:hypothetical protein
VSKQKREGLQKKEGRLECGSVRWDQMAIFSEHSDDFQKSMGMSTSAA